MILAILLAQAAAQAWWHRRHTDRAVKAAKLECSTHAATAIQEATAIAFDAGWLARERADDDDIDVYCDCPDCVRRAELRVN